MSFVPSWFPSPAATASGEFSACSGAIEYEYEYRCAEYEYDFQIQPDVADITLTAFQYPRQSDSRLPALQPPGQPAPRLPDVRLPAPVLQSLRAHSIAALRAAPLADEPRYMLALLDFAGGSPEQSRELLVQLASLRRQNAESLYQVGNAAAAGQMWDLARSIWQRSIQLHPNYVHSVLTRIENVPQLAPHEVVPSTPEALALAARQTLGADKPDERLIDEAAEVLGREVRRPIGFDPSLTADEIQRIRATRVSQLRVLAQIEMHRGQKRAAADLLGEVARLASDDPTALYAHAAALAAAGDKTAASRVATEGQQKAPNDPRFEQLLETLSVGSRQ